MKKSKIIKLLVSALSLCLIIGAMVGITAMAEETEPANPEIVSYNVSYSDELYLFYAVKATLAEGETIYLQICDENGNALEDGTDMDIVNPDKPANLSKITDWEIKTIYGEDYYVFVTNGVSAKDINKAEYVKAVVEKDGEIVREGDLVKYSVLNYLYQRLYKDNVVAATEGADLLRKDLYQSLVAYGAAAQELLLADELAAGTVTSILNSRYFVIPGISESIVTKTYIRPDSADLPAVEGQTFVGWKAVVYDRDGNLTVDGSKVYHDLSTFEVGAFIKATPVYVADGAEAPEVVDVYTDGVERFDSLEVPSDVKATGGVTAPTIVEEENGNRIIHFPGRTAYGNIAVTINSEDDDPGANTFIFECDIKTEDFGYVAFYLGTASSPTAGYTKRAINSNGAFTLGNAKGVLNEWCHFKAEYVKYTLDGAVKGHFNITITSEAYGETTQSYSIAADDAIDLSTATTFTFSHQGASTMTNTYFDNVKITKFHDHSLAPLTEKNGITFDDGVIPESITGAVSGIVSHTIVDAGDGNKALRVEKSVQKWANGGLKVKANEIEENANTFVFECDMLVSKYNQMAIYINNVTALNSADYTKIASVSGSIPAKYETAVGKPGSWVHFKVEYTKVEVDGVTKGQTIITIGDTSYTFTKDDTIDLTTADTIVFAVQTATIHDVLYDNIVCKKIYVAPVVEVPEESGEVTEG